MLVRADYSQIELRIAAKVSGDERMIEAYRRGEDLHALTARQLTGRAQVTGEERQRAKPVNFGLIYGQSAAALARKAKADYGVELSVAEAERYRGAFFEAWPGVKRWHDRLRGEVASGAPHVRTLSGRRVEVTSEDWYGRRASYIVQGTGGDGLKLALALLWERREQAPGAFPVLAVHDEIVVECDAGRADDVRDWLRRAMVDATAPLIGPVPVEVEVKSGRTWAGD